MPALRSDTIGTTVLDILNDRSRVVASTDRGWTGVIDELDELPVGVYEVLHADGTIAGGAAVDRQKRWRIWGRSE
jgi:hypothetical protein